MSADDPEQPKAKPAAIGSVSDVVQLRPTVRYEDVARLMTDLSRSTHSGMDEADIVERYFEAFQQLGPNRIWILRLLDAAGAVRLIRSSDPIPRHLSGEAMISDQALVSCGVDLSTEWPGVRRVQSYRCLIGQSGFDVPLFDGTQMVGIVACESEELSVPPMPELRVVCAPLGAMLARSRLTEDGSAFHRHLVGVLQSATIPLVVFNERGLIELTSQAFSDLIGKQIAPGTPFADLVASADRSKVVLASRELSSVECDVLGTDPMRMIFGFMSLALQEAGAAATIAVGRDIRQLRALEQQVIQAEKLATLGQLAAGVVHELNNPLTSIAVYSEHLLDAAITSERPAEEVDRLSRIVESSDRIRRFTQSLVTYARPAVGPPRAIVVADLLDEALGFCEHVIRDVDARIKVNVPAELPRALGVRASLHQVFINLITNACQAMPRGEGVLTISAEHAFDTVLIRVQDNGGGIPDHLRERVFEPFFSTKGEGQGTGLGLSIVRNILERHNGSITECGESTQGACFVVELPVALPVAT